jgi:hypothetical protein
MTTVTRFLVDKRHLDQVQITTEPAATLAPGQARLRIERLALTANNVSYAATGEMLHYWAFFPAQEPWGCVPAWGFATVAESLAEGVAVGERVYGFWPMASQLVLEPVKVNPHAFVDGIAHRRALPAVYNSYPRCAVDPFHRPGQDDAEALLRPMFTTAWLVDDFMADNGCFGATKAVLSSASSKTAYGTAFQMHRRGGVEVVGLTAERNRAFVQALGCYHRVLSYDQVGELDAAAPSVYLDYAGSAELRRRIHSQLPGLRYSCSIGAAHVDKIGSAEGLPGPKPIFMFAPTQAAKRAAEWGAGGLIQRMGRDWAAFVTRSLDPKDPWLVVQQHEGPAAAQAAWQQILAGASSARNGHILRLRQD